MTGPRSPLLDLPGAVAADNPDSAVAAHYGDPFLEQRLLEAGRGLVDRSSRGVVRVAGPDRRSWLHSLTSAHLTDLAPGAGTQALVLDPHGHVEHHLSLTDDGESIWLHVEPGTASPLVGFLDSMRFMLRVEVTDVSADFAVVWAPAAREDLGSGPRFHAAAGVDHFLPRSRVAELGAELGALARGEAEIAGLSAYEALRVAAGVPRLGFDTDPRTIPHEVGWVESAVHLDKGCYRGQETVARVYNLGRPPRRLVRLQLDGSEDRLPEQGDPVLHEGTEVGFAGTAVRHHEYGPIALALIKRGVPVDAPLTVAGIAAAQEEIVPADTGPRVVVPRLGRGITPRPGR